jgi:hypothetical protein
MKLLEAADLIGMVEELSAPGREQTSPLTRAGLRITLKNVRDSILASHDALAAELVAAGTVRGEGTVALTNARPTTHPLGDASDAATAKKPTPPRRDLRSSIERFIDPVET